VNHLVGVSNGRRNHIGAARPLAQIDNFAAVAAEREVGVVALDSFLADRTPESYSALARHGREI